MTDLQLFESLYQKWKANDVQFVICEVPDMAGMSRSKVVPLEGWREKQGRLRMISVMSTADSSTDLVMETLSETTPYRDALLLPDFATAQIVPWYAHAGRVIYDPYWPDGTPILSAPRQVLKQVIAQLAEKGITSQVALEPEFYLFRSIDPVEPAFSHLHIFRTHNNLAEPLPSIVTELEQVGLRILSFNTEYGPGQYEITYREQEGLLAADQAYTLKQAVKIIAEQHNFTASFMTKPYLEQSANGLHVHFSLTDANNTSLISSTEDSQNLSPTGYQIVAGLLKHAPAAQALFAPTPNCYRRSQHHSFAPVNVSWGIDDRTALIRVQSPGEPGMHLEHRAPSGLANPYLAVATVLACVLLGIREQQRAPEPATGPAEEQETLLELPTTLEQALNAFEQDQALRQVLGEPFSTNFLHVKRHELERQQGSVPTDAGEQEREAALFSWERREYLPYY